MNEETNVSRRVNENIKRSNGILTEQDLKDAYIYFNGLCPYSDTPISDQIWHLEHIIPVTMGGTTDPWNCIPVCAPCNLSKGGKHLLDWWDLEHKPEEEYKLEKIFNYIIEQLNKPRDYQITTKDQVFVDKLLKEEQNIEEQDEDIIYNEEEQVHLDTFTFLYQLVNHLYSNKQYLKEDINKHIEKLNTAYNNNSQYERLDTELFKLQNDLVEYLKSIGVTQHYSIAFKYSTKISSLDVIKNNINSIKTYLHKDDISDLINKNPDIILMDEVELSSKVEYIVNILEIPLSVFFDKPSIINQLEPLKELYSYCNENNINFNDIPNWTFSKYRIKRIKETIKTCKQNGINPEGNIFKKSIEELKEIIKICDDNQIKDIKSIFKRSSEEIQKIIDICKEHNLEITGSVFNNSHEEILKIIEVCQNLNIPPKGDILRAKANEIPEIVKICKEKGIEIEGGAIFKQSLDEIRKIIDICEKNGINPKGTIFRQNSDEIQKIIEICKKNKIKIEENKTIFMKPSEEIKEIIKICINNRIKPEAMMFRRSAKETEKIIQIRKKYEIKGGTIFCQPPEEIEKIINICKEKEIKLENSMFMKSSKEVQQIIDICNDRKVKIYGTMFKQNADEIIKIIDICKKYKIKPEGTIFNQSSEEIEKIINICKEKKIKLEKTMFAKSSKEVQQIIDICNDRKVKIYGTMFNQNIDEIIKIIDICEKNNIEIIGSIFKSNSNEIPKIFEICELNEIEIEASMFSKSAKEIEKIIGVCRKNNIEIVGSVFQKKDKDLNETIQYLRTNWGNDYLKSLIIIISPKKLEQVFPYLDSLGVLPIVINSASILTLTLDEIVERKNVLDYLGEPIIVKNKFHKIFGLSRKNYQKKLEELNISNGRKR